MRIAFNPSTVEALIAPPNNKDITFDLRGQNIFARGVKFCGTDTNTWRDIKINNVSIDSNILDLRDGDNTTLTNINGVVAINSTWRPVVDNLTSDSTTSSLSANLGRVLVGLIDGKSDSDHNHDDRYLKLIGGTMLLGKGLKFHADNSYFGTDLNARIISLLDSDNKICNGGLIIDERTTLDDKEYITELLRIRDSEFKWRGNNILHSGNSYIKENTITINGSSTTWENTWRTILVNDISIGKAPLNIKAGNGISLSESNGTITVTSTSSSPNVILLQYLSNTDTTWFPLIWGGSSHNNTSDSTGTVYKSYDVLSWLTSSLTLYATHLRTTYIDLKNNRGISLVTSGGTSPYKGIRLPDLQSNGIGIFSRVGNGSDEGGIVLSEDTCVIYNSFDAGWGLSVRDKDRNQTDISGDDTIAFGVRQDYRAYSLGGFEKSGSDNSYVLLGGGGHKLESSLNVANADTVDGFHATDGRTFTGNINWSPNWNDCWSDGTHTHPWYGFDHRYENTGAYSTTISDYFGMTIKTQNTLRLDFGTLILNSGNVGIGTTSPVYKLHVAGNIYSSGQIIREGQSTIWAYGRGVALLRETSAPGYHTLWSLKTTNGSWDFGEYNTSGWYNVPVLSYITDSNYNSGNNVTTYQIKFPLASGTVALTSYGGDNSHPIFLGYLNLDHGNDGTVSSSFYCLGYSVPFTYTRGGNYCRINIPDTSYQVFYIRAAIASVNYSGGGMDTWVGEHRADGAWWLHCYASSANEVRVKGFHLRNDNNDSWWGGNPLWSSNGGANRITVCIFGYVTFR